MRTAYFKSVQRHAWVHRGFMTALGVSAVLTLGLAGGCASHAQEGAGIGAGLGAIGGGIIGHQSGHGLEGAAIGAGAGALGGYIFGNEQDKAEQRRYDRNYDY